MDKQGQKHKEYNAHYYKEHKREAQEYARRNAGHIQEWRSQNMYKIRITRNKAEAKYRQKIRQEIFSMLGNKCVSCGYNTDARAFQIDHINGGGSIERRTYHNNTAYYKHILDCKGEGYQLLCANCNQIKCYETGEYLAIIKGDEQWQIKALGTRFPIG